jgi:hypothetical protein
VTRVATRPETLRACEYGGMSIYLTSVLGVLRVGLSEARSVAGAIGGYRPWASAELPAGQGHDPAGGATPSWHARTPRRRVDAWVREGLARLLTSVRALMHSRGRGRPATTTVAASSNVDLVSARTVSAPEGDPGTHVQPAGLRRS